MVWRGYTMPTQELDSYTVLFRINGSSAVDLGNDTTICIGSSLELSAGSSTLSYLWSTGSVDSVITIDTAGTYWLTVTNGLVRQVIPSSSMTPFVLHRLLSSSNDTASVRKNFCVNCSDSSVNDPFSWQWIFEGGNPAVSALQNPSNICYSLAGTYDVTLITETASGSDTLCCPTTSPFIHSPAPAISQNGNRAYLLPRFVLPVAVQYGRHSWCNEPGLHSSPNPVCTP
jgi:hypothetical protein